MSNLSELLPAGGGQNNTDFVASGAIASGKPVILNSAGTVTQVAESTSSDVIPAGSAVSYSGGTNTDDLQNVAWDSGDTDKFLYVTENMSGNRAGVARVGTVSNSGGSTSISLGTAFIFLTPNTPSGSRCYIAGLAADPNNAGKFLCVWADERDYPDYPFFAIVLNISGTNVTKGTEQDLGDWAGGCGNLYFKQRHLVADPNVENQFLLTNNRRDSPQRAYVQVLTVASGSGTTISYTTPVEVGAASGSSTITDTMIAADPNTAGKFVTVYRDGNNNNYYSSQCITLSGTTATTGTSVVIASQIPITPSIDFNSSVAGQFVAVHYGNLNGVSAQRTAQGRVGQLTGTSISYAANAVGAGSAAESTDPATIVSVGRNKFMLSYVPNSGGSAQKLMQQVGTISSGAITWGTRVDTGSSTLTVGSAADPNNAGRVVTTRSVGTGGPPDYNYIHISEVGTTSTNMTSSTLLGISSAAISNAATGTINTWGSFSEVGNASLPQAISLGTAATVASVTSNDNDYVVSCYDSTNNKVIVAYRTISTNDLYAVVGTISGTSVSYGTPVQFSTSGQAPVITYDSTNSKVVIAFRDDNDSSNGAGIVGTVSGTGISFGSSTAFNTTGAYTTPRDIAFDANAGKVLITWTQQSTDYSNSIVGTVSGTGISFGSLVTMDSNAGQYPRVTYDANAQKCVVVTRRTSGTAGITGVGTISGTSVSYGTLVSLDTIQTSHNITYDSTAQKIVVSYVAETGSYLKAIVGTVSGTSISFGTAAVVRAQTDNGKTDIVYDSGSNRLILAANDGNLPDDSYTAYIGTLSGTDTTWGTATVYASTVDGGFCHPTYDVNADKTLFLYNVSTPALKSIVGTIGDGVLTIASDYYAQADGTISTTSTSPAQLIGKAISATQINIKDYTG